MDLEESVLIVVIGTIICFALFLGYALMVNWRAQDLQRARFCAREFSRVPALCAPKANDKK